MAAAMKLNSSNSPIYLPDKEQTSILRLGFENCAGGDWIFPTADLNVFHSHKTDLSISRNDECFAETQESAGAQIEFYDFLLQHLLTNSQLGYSKRENCLVHARENLRWVIEDRNLWLASLWVPEDFCLLEKKENGYVMTAASVCSPSNWILQEKIGQTVEFIHDPVPDYDSILSERVNRFLAGMRSDRVMLRYNWSIQSGNELLWRDDLNPMLDAAGIRHSNLYWRIERQTFIRLPRSGVVVFGIRVFLYSFNILRNIKGFDQSIEQLLSQLSEAEKQYKGLAT
ncbi:MAG: hypothetical protein COB20_03395 [SAR86 cluster bacterium]|uniref:DUF3445 domain-containing protein n=1 Tax=SAR86 cluster bacterium TaxID=2030880 RepID=A0A2A4XD68_9GAMM|nr:MAG: hypothetical protein COB20_03395 [SAR86 cluster bacterium]